MTNVANALASANDSGNLTVEFTPEAGGGVGDNITLTAMLLPARGKDESFVGVGGSRGRHL